MQEFSDGQCNSISFRRSAVALYDSLLEIANSMMAHELVSLLSEEPS